MTPVTQDLQVLDRLDLQERLVRLEMPATPVTPDRAEPVQQVRREMLGAQVTLARVGPDQRGMQVPLVTPVHPEQDPPVTLVTLEVPVTPVPLAQALRVTQEIRAARETQGRPARVRRV